MDPEVGDPPEMEKQSQRQGVKEFMENNVRIKKAGGKTKLNFYFVPDRTGQAACRVSSSPSPFWKRLYLWDIHQVSDFTTRRVGQLFEQNTFIPE